MALNFKSASIKQALDVQAAKEATTDIDQNPLIDPIIDQVDQMIADSEKPPILQRIAEIEKLMAAEQIPIATLKSACRTVMLTLKDNADTILELEPADIGQVVQAYMAIADEETKRVFTKQSKKKATKKALSTKAKELQNMAKEQEGGSSFDFL